jgi:hypothetical protein
MSRWATENLLDPQKHNRTTPKTTTQRMHVIQFNELPDIRNVDSVSPRERECLEAIRGVLEAHDCIERFGVTLLHNHFHLDEDEILVETLDAKNRTLVSRPRKTNEVDFGRLIETYWRWDKHFMNGCEKFCPTDPNGKHYGYKDHD